MQLFINNTDEWSYYLAPLFHIATEIISTTCIQQQMLMDIYNIINIH